ncbi:MAG TPA: carboxypeptidase-like regulatory domain-containing protein, partial [Candidatus Methylomirabilis sp.]|nr:carboxypeptidase-like regulatory domain-containing protein [Candidatus Methylomirabilis sp.]
MLNGTGAALPKQVYFANSRLSSLCPYAIRRPCTGNSARINYFSAHAGSIDEIGTVTDPSGAVVAGAKVTITNKATSQILNLTTNAAGSYNSGPLAPGDYALRVESSGFKTTELTLTVLVNTTANGSVRLQLGQASEVVLVQS